jgi:cell division septation protein DedD
VVVSTASVKDEDSDNLGVVVVMTTTSIRPMEQVHKDRLSSWAKAIAWVALAAVVVLALVVATAGIYAEWFTASPRYDAIGGHFSLNMVPVKHPVPDAGFYCAGIRWFSVPLPDPQLVAAEVNAAPNAAAHRAALSFYNDLVDGRSTTSDLATVDTTYACPNGR